VRAVGYYPRAGVTVRATPRDPEETARRAAAREVRFHAPAYVQVRVPNCAESGRTTV
jgi:hypothetical protein